MVAMAAVSLPKDTMSADAALPTPATSDLESKYARLLMAVKDSGSGVFVDVFENAHGDTFYLGYKQGGVIASPLIAGPEKVSPTGIKYAEVHTRVLHPETRLMHWEPRGYLITDDALLGFTVPEESDVPEVAAIPSPPKSIRESIIEAVHADQHSAAEILSYVCAQIPARESSVRTQLCTLSTSGVLTREGEPGQYTYYLATPSSQE